MSLMVVAVIICLFAHDYAEFLSCANSSDQKINKIFTIKTDLVKSARPLSFFNNSVAFFVDKRGRSICDLVAL